MMTAIFMMRMAFPPPVATKPLENIPPGCMILTRVDRLNSPHTVREPSAEATNGALMKATSSRWMVHSGPAAAAVGQCWALRTRPENYGVSLAIVPGDRPVLGGCHLRWMLPDCHLVSLSRCSLTRSLMSQGRLSWVGTIPKRYDS